MKLNTTIDRTSYIPYYIQVVDILKDYIDHGGGQPGEQLPGEPELCRLFPASRTVIRQALKELEYDGLIVLVNTYLPYALCPELLAADLTQQSLYSFLEQEYDLLIVRGQRILEAVLTNEYEAELLPAAPMIISGQQNWLIPTG
jgi:GntR family transcriptional regulator